MSLVVFAVILLFSAILRFWQLGSVPDGFHTDEADYGYNAYSLWKTGKDQYGKRYPLIYRSLGDYKGAVYAYLTIPFIAATGLNEWAVRAPSAAFGILFIVLTFAFVYRISKNYRLALLSMALAAISPLGILLSRVQSDPLVGAFFFYLGFYLLLVWIEKKHVWQIVASVASLYIGFYTYSNAQLFVLPFLVLLGIRYWSSWSKKIRITIIVIFSVLFFTILGFIMTSAGTRLGQVSVFSTKDVQIPLEEQIREDGAMNMPILFTRVFHNKITAYGQYVLDNYASYFSYNFLFRQAGEPAREQIPNSGVLFIVDLPFLLIGMYVVFRKKYSYGITAVLWLLMIPAMLSIASGETPNIHRFIWAVIPVYLLVATGILFLYDNIVQCKKALFALGVFFLYVLNGCIFLEHLFVHQPIHNPIFRNSADKELALTLKSLYKSYDVVVSQKILPHILFFWPIEPEMYQQEGSPRDTEGSRYRNILFVGDSCPSFLTNPTVASLSAARVLYVNRAECHLTKNDRIIKIITYKNTLDAYYLVEKQ